ncbi:MAG: beta-galactosidase trimerization domain-containing protein [Gemmataceae bacterium]
MPTRRELILGGLAAGVGVVHAAAPPPANPRAWIGRVTAMAFGTPGEVERLAAMGAEVLHTNLVWPYYPLQRDGGGLPRAERDQLARLARTCRQKGLRLSLGLPPFMPVALARRHPTWREQPDPKATAPRGEPAEDNLGTRAGCNHGPWGDYLIEVCCELAADFQLDGFSFDGGYHPPICYCPACRAAYRKDHDRELPSRVDLNEIAYREYLVWRGQKLVAHYTRMRQRLAEARPGTALMSWTVNAGRFGHFLHSPRAMPIEVNRLFDLPMQEWWLEESNLGASVVPAFGVAYLRAVAGDGPCASEPYLMTRAQPPTSDSFPHVERLARALLAVTHGSVGAHSVGWPGHRESTADILTEIRRRAPWLTHTRRLPWAGLLVSEQTRQFVHYARIRERFLPPALGLFRAAVEEHLPLGLLTDLELTPASLAPHRVILLPDAVALSNQQAAALRSYVESGGGLIATGETSLADELGRPRSRFALADLFGVTPQGRFDGVARLELDRKAWTDSRLARLVPEGTVTFRGPLVRTTASPKVETLARLTIPDKGTFPAIVRQRFGKGRVVYLPAGLDVALWSYAYPYQRILLAELIRWAAGGPPPITVEAPRCVQMTCFTQGPQTTLVHLFNNVVTTAHHGDPSTEVPLREEVLPIHGVRVRFHGAGPRRCVLQPEGRALTLRREGASTVALVPRLDLHAIVVCEE